MKIAIIGAGLAGLTLANHLRETHDVTVLEKARGVGGRMSTRRADPYAFDHGAQYFTAETDAFQTFIEDMQAHGLVSLWPDHIELSGNAFVSGKTKYIAQPGMNAICKHLAEGLDIRPQTHVETIEEANNGWRLTSKDGAKIGEFDFVISTAPSVQTSSLMPQAFSGHETLKTVRMLGCFALMLGFDQPIDLNWSALKSGAPPVGWIAVNSQKPHRPEPFSILIQSDNEWAEAHLDTPPEDVINTLLQAASTLTGTDLATASHKVLHRWRYASTAQPAGAPYLLDESLKLAACGDWCLGSKVEAAFSSAKALAEAILSSSET